MVFAKGWEEGKKEKQSFCSVGMKFQFCKIKSYREQLLNCTMHLKIVKMVNMLCVFYQN